MKTMTTRIGKRNDERGAALVALIALMTLVALALLAAAPNLLQEVQRGKELEAMRRGDEIADAIRIYARVNRKLPQRMEDLLEGVPVPGRTKKLMILRSSAARDPLSSTGEWKTVQTGDKEIVGFHRKVLNYNNGSTPASPPEVTQPMGGLAFIANSIDTDTSEEAEDAPGGEDDADNVEGPFVGVRSRSQRRSVLTFYSIERHDRWLFTPLFRSTMQPGETRGQPGAGGGGAAPPQ